MPPMAVSRRRTGTITRLLMSTLHRKSSKIIDLVILVSGWNIAVTLTCCVIKQHNRLVFIHDYHLLLVPELVRKAIPHASIGLFFHATFPSSEIFRCLTSKVITNFPLCNITISWPKIFLSTFSARNEILQGMLGANLVGFQVRRTEQQ